MKKEQPSTVTQVVAAMQALDAYSGQNTGHFSGRDALHDDPSLGEEDAG